MSTTHHDVLVVGAGPAGLTTAIALARHGLDVLVVEKHAGTSPFPKATGVSTRTMELLRTWGLDAQVRAGAMHVRPVLSVSDTLAGREIDAVPTGYPTDEQALAVSPVTPCYCPQDHLEPVLLAHLRERGGRVRFATEVLAVAVTAAGARAELLDRASGLRSVARARYLVGADGPRSGVRAALGIGVADLGTIGDFVAVTFRADLTRRLPRIPGALNAVQTPGADGLLVPTGAGDRWVFARRCHPGDGGPPTDWTPLLRAATGLCDLEPRILAVMPIELGGHLADAFRAGPGFLVGDAAHRTTPVGGVGMNIAIHAAHDLGWRLAWVLRGWAAEALLDGYEAERRPVGGAAVRRSLAEEPTPGADALAADLGTRAPHVRVRHRGAPVSTLDLFDGRLTLLTGRRGERWRQAAAGPARGGLPITALSAGRDLHDDGEAGTGVAVRYGLGEAGAALVRPDGVLAWRHPGPAADPGSALRAAVDAALGRSTAPTLAAAG